MTKVDRVALCDDCWKARHPGREPSRVIGEAVSTETCHLCDDTTRSGIWVLRASLAPRRTGKPPEEVVLTGMVLPWHSGMPSLIELPGAGNTWLEAVVVFSTVEKLEAAVKAIGLPCERIKKIDEHWEFLASIPPELLVVVDPWVTPQGTTRYTQVLRD